jgi:hypothetical protein
MRPVSTGVARGSTLSALLLAAAAAAVQLASCGSGHGDAATGADAGSADGAPCSIDAALDGTLVLCDDFDHAALGAFWSGTTLGGGALLAVDPGGSVSSPNSLLVTLPASPEAGTFQAALYEDLPAGMTGVDCTSDLRLDALDGKQDIDVVVLSLTSATGDPRSYELALSLEVNGAPSTYLTESLKPAEAGLVQYLYPAASPAPGGGWMHLRMEVTLAGDGTGKVSLWQDGTQTVKVPITPPKSVVAARWFVGVKNATGQPAASATAVRHDNVVCTVTY